MSRLPPAAIVLSLACALQAAGAQAQVAPKSKAADPAETTRAALGLVQSGRCSEALPVLRRNLDRLADRQLRYYAAFAVARCGMSVDDAVAAMEGLTLLRRDFPDDPEVLYASARMLAQLAERTGRELADRFPESAQVGKLNAEALEAKQMWKEANEAYRRILEKHPRFPGIHYRIASILLDTSPGPESMAEAQKELEAELEIDPKNAAAVFALGEIARRSGAWDQAVERFTRASQLDVGFLEAYLALGMTLNAAGRYAEAVAPLERYAQGVPDDPAGHYQLAIAYARTGNKEGAERELKLQREAAAKAAARRPPGPR